MPQQRTKRHEQDQIESEVDRVALMRAVREGVDAAWPRDKIERRKRACDDAQQPDEEQTPAHAHKSKTPVCLPVSLGAECTVDEITLENR
jgi:hypothetical protein